MPACPVFFNKAKLKNRTHSLFSKISSEDVSKIFNSLGPVSEHRPSHLSKSADISSEIKISSAAEKVCFATISRFGQRLTFFTLG